MLRVSVSKGKGKEKDEEETLKVHLPSAKRQFNAVLYGDMVQKGFAHLYGGSASHLHLPHSQNFKCLLFNSCVER
jgi:hypothetical protein